MSLERPFINFSHNYVRHSKNSVRVYGSLPRIFVEMIWGMTLDKFFGLKRKSKSKKLKKDVTLPENFILGSTADSFSKSNILEKKDKGI